MTRFAALLLILTLAITGVFAQDDTETIRVVFIAARSGTDGAADQAAYAAAQQAVREVNDNDDDPVEATDGTRYEIEIERVLVTDGDDALDAYQDALDDGADVVLASVSTSLQDALLGRASLPIPVLYFAENDSNPAAAIKLAPDVQSQITAMADYIIDERGAQSVAIVNADTVTADARADAFERAIGVGALALRSVHEADETDFSDVARSVRDSDADAIFVWTLDAQGRALLRALDDVGWSGLVMYGDIDAGFVTASSAELIDGLLGPAAWNPTAVNPQTRAFTTEYAAGADSPTLTEESGAYYDAISLIAETLRRTPTLSRVNLGATSFTGVQGDYTNGRPNTVRLFEIGAGGEWIEAARYVGAVCETCPDFFVSDTTEVNEAREVLFNIALLADQSGTTSEVGRHAQQAIELAVREINELGGIIGPQNVRYTLRLAVYDAPDATAAPAAFERAVREGANVIVGPDLNSYVVLTALAADAVGIPQIATATGLTSPSLSTLQFLKQGRSNDRTRAAAAVSFVSEELELTNLALIVGRTDWGLNVQSAVRAAVRATEDAELVFSAEHGPELPDLSVFVPDILNSGAEAVMVWSTPASMLSLVQALAETEWQGTLVYGYALPNLPELASLASLPDGVRLLLPVGWWPTATDWAGRWFADQYRELFDEEPIEQTAAYYDAIHLIRRAIEVGGPAPAALQDFLTNDAQFIGAQGTYNPATYGTGELTQAVMILEWRDGQMAPAARYNACDGVCDRVD
ncbi:MAG: ABC transporter substrate-binding protein [Chloroflexi bacterium]|nr:ABC transporter substrate-binding protein [Chloroflexota bacterium]